MSGDVIDQLAGLAPTDPVAVLRTTRPVARAQSQAAHDALLAPDADADAGFPVAERLALAVFVAALHSSASALAHYRGLLEALPQGAAWADALVADADGPAQGPVGRYREEGLSAEGLPADTFALRAGREELYGPRLAAALAHAHLLVVRPREASRVDLDALLGAGWSRRGIVTLSQEIGFLTYQFRVAEGLAVLAAEGQR